MSGSSAQSLVVEPSQPNIAAAVVKLRAGEVVALPTETVYGLAADAMNESAVRKVFALKGRPADNPLIVHVLDAAKASALTTGWDERCTALARRFWPGPLTLVLRRASCVPDVVTAGGETVALRSPAHPVMREVLEIFAGPLAAPSANRSTHVSPTSAAHVAAEFADAPTLMIIDGGPCAVGIESTVLDMTNVTPCVLRHGAVTVEMLRESIGAVAVAELTQQSHSPGTSPRHYAPRTPSELVNHESLVGRLQDARESRQLAVICFDVSLASAAATVIVLPGDPARCASTLYEALRHADSVGASRILIERPRATTGLWAAILDRLTRATASR